MKFKGNKLNELSLSPDPYKFGNTLIFDENDIATDDFDKNQYKLEKDVLVEL